MYRQDTSRSRSDGGFNLLGPFPGRDDDIAGIAVAYGAISRDLQDGSKVKKGLPTVDVEAQK